MGGLRDGSRNGWIGGSKNGAFFVFLFIIIYITNFAPMFSSNVQLYGWVIACRCPDKGGVLVYIHKHNHISTYIHIYIHEHNMTNT